ncbi:hypothetical protein VIBNISOn1_30058 [Vibrio nigripulchritudo SOn1]|uniref:Lipoprotein n=1 Tax=Vibrio nigripulchritudo SOn1 TaxID=1238450 RepID=A0AAV2VRN4_9VIBR|nr:hypothetical protein [Vibrio nigripulchritudo]CCO47367.1 hypothetical protein VIBNISOn1_30058 [Vibrio nigripulchritudo SOn1]
MTKTFQKISTLSLVGLLTACSEAGAEKPINQFSVENDQLLFEKKFVDDWNVNQNVPSCSDCRKESQIKYLPDGPEVYETFLNSSGLQFMLGKNIRHPFDIDLVNDIVTFRFSMIDGDVYLQAENHEPKPVSTDAQLQLDISDHRVIFTFSDIYIPEPTPDTISNEQPKFSVDFYLTTSSK